MTFRNNRGQAANLTQVLEERSAQRRQAVPPVNTHIDTSSTDSFTGIWNSPYDGDYFTSILRPTGSVSHWQQAVRTRTRPDPEPVIVAHMPGFSVPPRSRYRNRQKSQVLGMAEFRKLHPKAMSQELNRHSQKLRVESKKAFKRLAETYRTIMVMNVDYVGKTFKYKARSDGTAIWCFEWDNTPLVVMDTNECRIIELILPKKRFQNQARYLWRVLGFDAVRYKDTTLVRLGDAGVVLNPGDKWALSPDIIKPYALTTQEPEQLKLWE